MDRNKRERKPAHKSHRRPDAPNQRPAARKSPDGKRRSSAAAGGRRPARSSGRRPSSAPTPRQQPPVQDVVYLPPKPFNRNRLLLRLVTITAVVVAIFLASSVFFKVGEGKVLVSGTNKYTAWDVCKASGIRPGDNLLTFGQAKAAGRIRKALPYVKSVRIGIKLPNTVNIEIEELEVTYAVKAQDESWWLLSADGRVVDQATAGFETKRTQLLGVSILNPQIGQKAQAWSDPQAATDGEGNPVPVTVTAEEKLATALSIAEYLELNGIIGDAANIDVTDFGNLQLWYGKRYQVKLGDNSQLSYKISCMKGVISQMDSHQSGVLDVTFTTYPNDVGYTPFH